MKSTSFPLWSHFNESGVSIPSGANILIGKSEYDLCTGELK